ncbi:hypothetical protein RHMOL_Rhmol01G0119600 [Rhododendron molle]|uniref:Uncharacterized protein n=1 Tax=Rhododendron molle TaxID=49168 RepID=A0ACC0Q1W5_RHOML|nr:hypothetical protein RHMOL_Rhmol01G0119600 [Rhododendron molle]
MMRVLNTVIQLYLLITELIAERHRQRLRQKPHLRANPNVYQSQLDALNRLVRQNDKTCHANLRVNRHTFMTLCQLLIENGLEPSRHVTVAEKVEIFLWILAHHTKNRRTILQFWRSGETISRHFNAVLIAVICLHNVLWYHPQPIPANEPDARWKWFEVSIPMESEGTSQSEPTSRKRKQDRRLWTFAEEEALLAAMMECICDKYRAHNGFKPGYFNEVEKEKRLPGTTLKAQPNIESKVKGWKEKYNVIVDITRLSGFGWNYTTNSIVVDDENVWKEYEKSNTKAKGLNGKSFPMYESWQLLFGKDRATGEMAEDAAEVEEVVETYQDEGNIDLDDMFNECYTPTFPNGDTVFPRATPGVDISTSSGTPTSNAIPTATTSNANTARSNANTPTTNANAPTSNVVSGRPKKKAKVDTNEASIHVAVENILAQSNTAFNKIADAVGYEDRLSAKREKVFTELMKLDLEMIDSHAMNMVWTELDMVRTDLVSEISGFAMNMVWTDLAMVWTDLAMCWCSSLASVLLFLGCLTICFLAAIRAVLFCCLLCGVAATGCYMLVSVSWLPYNMFLATCSIGYDDMTDNFDDFTMSSEDCRNYWVVFVGRNSGIYTSWETAELQVNGYPGNLKKRYNTFDEAEGALLQFHEERYRLNQMQSVRTEHQSTDDASISTSSLQVQHQQSLSTCFVLGIFLVETGNTKPRVEHRRYKAHETNTIQTSPSATKTDTRHDKFNGSPESPSPSSNSHRVHSPLLRRRTKDLRRGNAKSCRTPRYGGSEEDSLDVLSGKLMVLVPTHQSQSVRYSHPLGKIVPCWPYVTWSSGKHILNYPGRRKLEVHMKVDDIMMLKDLPMRDFVTEVWDAVGKGFINKEDRYRSGGGGPPPPPPSFASSPLILSLDSPVYLLSAVCDSAKRNPENCMLGHSKIIDSKTRPYVGIPYGEAYDSALRMGSAIRSHGVNPVSSFKVLWMYFQNLSFAISGFVLVCGFTVGSHVSFESFRISDGQEMEATMVDGNGTETGHKIVTTIGGRNGQLKQVRTYTSDNYWWSEWPVEAGIVQ